MVAVACFLFTFLNVRGGVVLGVFKRVHRIDLQSKTPDDNEQF